MVSCAACGYSVTTRTKCLGNNIPSILYGPRYSLKISAISDIPSFLFSFTNYDYEYCIVQKGSTKYYSAFLKFSNVDNIPLMLENHFENNKHLTVNFQSAKISPRNSVQVSIYFHPQTIGRHNFKIPFMVNTNEIIINITGEGIPLKLQLVKDTDKVIDLGKVKIGTKKTYKVAVVNSMPTQVDVFFDLFDRLPIQLKSPDKLEQEMKLPIVPVVEHKKDKNKNGKKAKAEPKEKKQAKKTKGKAEPAEVEVIQIETAEEKMKKMLTGSLTILPNEYIHLGPREVTNIYVIFEAKRGLDKFKEKIFFEVQDYVIPLCEVKGSSVFPEFSLDKHFLMFPNVILSCKSSMMVELRNSGDTRGRFHWNLDSYKDVFDMEPKQGYIDPKNSVSINFTFEPQKLKCETRAIAKCLINGLEKPLELKLLGNSVKMPDVKETINFACPVRQKDVKVITLSNQSTLIWDIEPRISNENFEVARNIKVPPKSDFLLTVDYLPQNMKAHEATLFFPLPEGRGYLYKLLGKPAPPLVTSRIEREISCKKKHTEILRVDNWLNSKQTFNITTSLISPITTKSLYKISGFSVIEIQPKDSKDYSWSIYPVNEVPLDFKVTFTNPETKEYIFYEIYLKVGPSRTLEKFTLNTCVRESVSINIKLKNPIDVPVTYNMETTAPYLNYNKTVVVEPYFSQDLTVAYTPLRSGVTTTTFIAKTEELGTFLYDLILNANPPVPNKPIKIIAELGLKGNTAIIWKDSMDFTSQIDHEEFTLEKVVSNRSGEPNKLNIHFQPSNREKLYGILQIISSTTGEYCFPLIGETVQPTPKGPYNVKQHGLSINFTNPFHETKIFLYKINTSAFLLKAEEEEIPPRKSTKIMVALPSIRDISQKQPAVGKLTVTCEDSGNPQWVFYLQSD